MNATLAVMSVVALALAAGPVAPRPERSPADLGRELADVERRFAKTMADRDFAAFQSFLAADAIFIGQRTGPVRGREAIAAAWKAFYEAPGAPFSWTPEIVEVLEAGALGLSSGPVFDPQGARIGTYNSIWRREADGQWRIVFDKGCPSCECGPGSVQAAARTQQPTPIRTAVGKMKPR